MDWASVLKGQELGSLGHVYGASDLGWGRGSCSLVLCGHASDLGEWRLGLLGSWGQSLSAADESQACWGLWMGPLTSTGQWEPGSLGLCGRGL